MPFFKVETVKVKHGDGYMVINKSDFDEAKYDLYEESPEPVDPGPDGGDRPSDDSEPVEKQTPEPPPKAKKRGRPKKVK